MNKLIKHILIILISFLSLGFVSDSEINYKKLKIKIQWTDSLNDDYDFIKNWNYPDGIYRNNYGQLSCDGLCPDETEFMKDKNGKIYLDSLTRFYQLVDTTHLFHSILCEAWCYEWAGTDFITAKQMNKNQIICSTKTNIMTHCCLILEIDENTCIPVIELNSISASVLKTYYCKTGYIKIDKDSLKNGILKAEFNFDFNNTDELDRKMYWKGKIYTTIENL